ncbi:RDD family protein [Thalassotalea mangrovi]|uniref:RDD family protein n=1 Tax=Thalassotalea mangrovi TaxID=2572245 RepID=A0A4U1B5Y1_9GAMM|nr:RDD family protein [Thalassotalea mangrovi]TKB45730.1 RDD family protein [Thalassotalea mangrovi]
MNADLIENASEQHHHLTRKETKEVITPFAFAIDETLFGTAIAAPWKRGVAMGLDLILIAVLSSAGGEFLALAIAIAAFRFGSKKRAAKLGKEDGTKRRALLRFTGAFILFLLLLSILPPLFNSGGNWQDKDYSGYADMDNKAADNTKDLQIGLGKSLELTGFIITTINKIEQKNCQQQVACWRDVLAPLPTQAIDLEFTAEQADILFTKIVEELPLTGEEQTLLADELKQSFASLAEQNSVPEQPAADTRVQSVGASSNDSTDQNNATEQKITTGSSSSEPATDSTQPVKESEKENQTGTTDEPARETESKGKVTKPIYSIVEYFKALIQDLGLGFGWAAFYFTICGTLFNGKTPGKKLLGIRVIQLDGTRLSLWDSFGRYGGYGAGLATGLLGFFQIFWDANRQAIHDKISATVVIDERKVVPPELVAMAREEQTDAEINDH